MEKEIIRGCEVKNVITEVTGIVVGRSESLNGTVQYNVKPIALIEGKPQDSTWLDSGAVVWTGEGIIGKTKIDEVTKTEIKLGNTVKHFNGFTGVAVERVEYMNGCVYIGIMPKTEDPNKMPKTEFQPCQYLEIKIEDKPVVTEADDKGGPASEAPTM